VRQQRGNRGDQSADSRGDANGGGEDVISEQRGRGSRLAGGAQVEACHGIGTAAGGVRFDGLAIGEVDNHQQGDDGGADGNDVLNAEKAQRD